MLLLLVRNKLMFVIFEIGKPPFLVCSDIRLDQGGGWAGLEPVTGLKSCARV